MGYQNGNDNSSEIANERWAKESNQRTTVTARESQNTTKAQYKRLSQTGPIVGGGE